MFVRNNSRIRWRVEIPASYPVFYMAENILLHSSGTTVYLGQQIGCGKKEDSGRTVGNAMIMFGIIAGDLLLCAVFNMGTEGAALATVLAQVISVIASFLFIRKKELPFILKKESLRIHKETLGKITALGAPIALQDTWKEQRKPYTTVHRFLLLHRFL